MCDQITLSLQVATFIYSLLEKIKIENVTKINGPLRFYLRILEMISMEGIPTKSRFVWVTKCILVE